MVAPNQILKWKSSAMIFSLILNVNGGKNMSLIYLLMWTYPDVEPFSLLEMGQQYFINKKCRYQNCFFTNNRTYFENLLDFDVIIYDSTNIRETKKPPVRSEKQKYVFLSYEPPSICPMPPNFDEFFNLTWTYRLDSDITLKYMVVRTKNGRIVAPKKNPKWIDEVNMKPTSKYIRNKLKNKKKPAAWFVSNCFVASQRQGYIETLRLEMNKNYNMTVDIYGRCSYMECPKASIDECYALLESDYYFYLAFENSFCEDYVTEKVLTALEHFAVPIVYGGANYTRFLPPGSYLNAYSVEPKDLARIINDTINDLDKYYNYFKWHRYYTVHEPSERPDSNEVCGFCAFLNDKEKMSRTTVYTNITNFWSY